MMGSVAVQGVMGEKIPVMKKHGEVVDKNGRNYFITLHPAAAIRFMPLRKIFQGDFRKLKNLI